MMQFPRPAVEWRVLRNVGASLVLAGASVGVWGALAVTSVSATATAPDCTTSPPSGACLHDNSGFEDVTASSFTGLHDCTIEGGQGTTTDGFHFILPASEGTAFSSLTVYFDVAGTLVTETKSTGFIQGGNGAVIEEPNGATLLEGSATITGGSSGTASDGGDPFFVLSSTCPGSGGSSSSSSSSTSTGTGGSSGVTTTSSTTDGGHGGVLGASTPSLPKAGSQSGARPNLQGPLAIGIGLVVAGLTLFGFSYRRRETVG